MDARRKERAVSFRPRGSSAGAHDATLLGFAARRTGKSVASPPRRPDQLLPGRKTHRLHRDRAGKSHLEALSRRMELADGPLRPQEKYLRRTPQIERHGYDSHL